jgi:hypothetical protein
MGESNKALKEIERGALQWFVLEGILKNQQQADSIKITSKAIEGKDGVAKIKLSVDVSKTTEEIKAGILALQNKYNPSRVSITNSVDDKTVSIIGTSEDLFIAFLGGRVETLLQPAIKPGQAQRPTSQANTPQPLTPPSTSSPVLSNTQLSSLAINWLNNTLINTLSQSGIVIDLTNRVSAKIADDKPEVNSGRKSIEITIDTTRFNKNSREARSQIQAILKWGGGDDSWVSREGIAIRENVGLTEEQVKNGQTNIVIRGYEDTMKNMFGLPTPEVSLPAGQPQSSTNGLNKTSKQATLPATQNTVAINPQIHRGLRM